MRTIQEDYAAHKVNGAVCDPSAKLAGDEPHFSLSAVQRLAISRTPRQSKPAARVESGERLHSSLKIPKLILEFCNQLLSNT